MWVKHHFAEHHRIKSSNQELIQANAELTADIRKRDQVLADRELAYRKLSQSFRVAKSRITSANDQASVDWGDDVIAPVVFNGLLSASNASGESEAAAATSNRDVRADTERE